MSIPIDQAYPGVFSKGTGINVSPNVIHTVAGYTIDPFPVPEKNRNHYDSRAGINVKYLIMHYTVIDFAKTVYTFTSNVSKSRTSAHFVITQKEGKIDGGKLLQVVPDEMRAWHAGVSGWKKDRNLNASSLGIEHVNQGFTQREQHEARTYYPFDEEQICTSGLISKDIIQKYGIQPQYVLGHQDIAPGRKSDPGPLFPWARFYHDYGVGAWLDIKEMDKDYIIQKYRPKRPYPKTPDRNTLLQILNSYGYCMEGATASNVIKAFKAHFSANQLPEQHDTIGEAEMFWAWALEAKYNS